MINSWTLYHAATCPELVFNVKTLLIQKEIRPMWSVKPSFVNHESTFLLLDSVFGPSPYVDFVVWKETSKIRRALKSFGGLFHSHGGLKNHGF